jgi:hypothetical protein
MKKNQSGAMTPGTHRPDEVLYTNLFEVSFVLPSILGSAGQGRDNVILLENATKIDLGAANLTSWDIATKEQRYKFATRQFLTTPAKTSGEITIPFQVNQDTATGNMTVWATLKAWYDLVYNSSNGSTHYKEDIIGTIVVNQHDKKGVVIRRVTFHNCQLSKLTGWALDWGSNDIVQNVDATFIWDYHTDEYMDTKYSVSYGTGDNGTGASTITGYSGYDSSEPANLPNP